MNDAPAPKPDDEPEEIALVPALGAHGGVAVPQFVLEPEDIDLEPRLGRGGGVRVDEAAVPPEDRG